MKKNLLLILLVLFGITPLTAQVVLDFESPATTSELQYFGMKNMDVDGTPNNIIPNPDPTGVNTSAMVADFVKLPASEEWAGAFVVNMPFPLDFTVDTEICIDVWFSEPGNIALKPENSQQDYWILQQDVTEAQTWVNVCFNTALPSIEAPFLPGAGNVYNGLAMFLDFGEVLNAERLYYLDNIVIGEGGVVEPADVTFSVNMNDYTGTFNNVYVSGGFNDFSNANELTDADGDGIYSGVVQDVPLGSQEYRFQVDGFADGELFDGSEECTVVSDEIANRVVAITGTAELPTVCWGSCWNCGEEVTITVNLAVPADTVISEEGLFIAGGGTFGVPGDFPLTDDDGDGIYSITFTKGPNFESFYTFANGACDDFSCKEQIAGQSCSNPDNFDDRKMGPFTEDAVISTCFGQCSTTAECAEGSVVNFRVGMNNFTDTIFSTVYLSGTFNDWSENANPMSDDDGDGIWETSLILPDGEIEFKFQLDMWAAQEELNGDDDCTIVAGDMGEFVNRGFLVAGPTDVCVEFNSCDGCIALGINDLEVDASLFSIQPTLVRNETTLYFGENINDEVELQIFNALGQLMMVKNIQPQGGQYTLQVNDLTDGLYFVNIETGGKRQTQRIVLNR